MASNITPSNDAQDVQQQDKQNAVNQVQTGIEQQTAEAIAANNKSPSAIKKQIQSIRSLFSRPKREDKSRKSSHDPSDDILRSRCMMFFPTSGRMGFDKVEVSDELPPIEILREMITYETSIRLSEPIQELMDIYHKDEAALRCILDLIQQHVVEHFGYHHVNALRTALHRFPDDPAVKSAYYGKS
ncbi:unnamed protein product [Rotaria sp. Silwood1]|nr:unnamed protein product [Rotaria sp. Silwood1]CAF4930903.1 unnamed protein product [Rotaria sp. Silwood1]